ncbi:MAG: acyl-CoA dehydrogenase family protein [Chloroflexi bacterium]|nr:acyl-CoA dehydrogenase family protein [Chloroflexota bacterium]
MDYRLSVEDETFRHEVREFLKKEWRPVYYREYGGIAADMERPEIQAQSKEFAKKLVGKGWYTMSWPKELGGQDAPAGKQIVYAEELGYAGAPPGSPAGNITGAIMFHGSPTLKQDFLPKMANADVEWAQGFSEPNAGTDLASLQTRAVRDGDSFVISGQKIWTSGAYRANWGHFLTRTNPDAPKHRGISYFVVDMKTPGITLRPLYDMLGRHYWSEVFLDEVRVPADNMIGEEDRGWYAAMTTLNFERVGGPGRAASLLAHLDHFLDIAKETKFNGRPVLDDPVVKRQLAELRIQIEITRALAYRVAWVQSKGGEAAVEGSTLNYRGHLLSQFMFEPTLVKIIRYHRLFGIDEERALGHGMYGTKYIMEQGHGFAGGGGLWLAPNIIAQRGLGLPR